MFKQSWRKASWGFSYQQTCSSGQLLEGWTRSECARQTDGSRTSNPSTCILATWQDGFSLGFCISRADLYGRICQTPQRTKDAGSWATLMCVRSWCFFLIIFAEHILSLFFWFLLLLVGFFVKSDQDKYQQQHQQSTWLKPCSFIFNDCLSKMLGSILLTTAPTLEPATSSLAEKFAMPTLDPSCWWPNGTRKPPRQTWHWQDGPTLAARLTGSSPLRWRLGTWKIMEVDAVEGVQPQKHAKQKRASSEVQ